MYKIKLVDNVMFTTGTLDEAETLEEANVLKDAYEEEYPSEEGYEIGIEEEDDEY